MSLFEVNPTIARPDAGLVEALSHIAAANLSDAMANLNTMDSGIQALLTGAKICGPACTAVTPSGDFLPVLKALRAAERGDVLVVDNQGNPDTALWGEITSMEAHLKGLAGIILDGLVRDIAEIRELGFPVFARGTTPRVAGRGSLGEVNVAARCGGTVVQPRRHHRGRFRWRRRGSVAEGGGGLVARPVDCGLRGGTARPSCRWRFASRDIQPGRRVRIPAPSPRGVKKQWSVASSQWSVASGQ